VKGKRVFARIEKRAERFGSSAHVILPTEWAGETVVVELVKK